ncbi:MAG: MFS transporter, partial [Firmicutes bacterium]|nr:MFS transporter [Bacillota bacterium]
MNDKLFNPNYIKICLTCALFMAANQVTMVILPLYMDDLGYAPFFLGIATSISAFAAMAARPISGHFADKKGRLVVIIPGLVIMVAGMLGMNFMPFVAAIIFFRLAQGVGFSAISTAQMAIVTDVVPETKVKKGLAYFGIFPTIASAAGPAVAMALLFGSNYTPAWVGGAVLFASALAISATIRYKKPVAKRTTLAKSSSGHKRFWQYFEKSAMPPSIVFLVLMVANAGAVVFLPVYATEIGIEEFAIFYTLQACTMFVANIILGSALPKVRQPFYLLMLGIALFGGALFLLFVTGGIIIFSAAAIIYGFGLGIIMTTVSAMCMSSTTPDRRG